MVTDAELQEKYMRLLPHLDEKSRRLYLSSEAQNIGRGGKAKVSKLAGISRVRLNRGIKVSDKEWSEIQLERDTFRGEWNYSIYP